TGLVFSGNNAKVVDVSFRFIAGTAISPECPAATIAGCGGLALTGQYPKTAIRQSGTPPFDFFRRSGSRIVRGSLERPDRSSIRWGIPSGAVAAWSGQRPVPDCDQRRNGLRQPGDITSRSAK